MPILTLTQTLIQVQTQVQPSNPTPYQTQPPNPTHISPQSLQWEIQTVERLHSLFFSHTTNVPISSSEQTWKALLQQIKTDDRSQTHLSQFFNMVSLWGLVRIHGTEDLEARRQFGLFVGHLQDAEQTLLKAVQMTQKAQKQFSQVPPTHVVSSLPLTM